MKVKATVFLKKLCWIFWTNNAHISCIHFIFLFYSSSSIILLCMMQNLIVYWFLYFWCKNQCPFIFLQLISITQIKRLAFYLNMRAIRSKCKCFQNLHSFQMQYLNGVFSEENGRQAVMTYCLVNVIAILEKLYGGKNSIFVSMRTNIRLFDTLLSVNA